MCKRFYLEEEEIGRYLDYSISGSITVASYIDFGIDVVLFYGKDPTIVVTQDDIIIYSCAIFKENLEEKLGYIEDEFLTERGVTRNFLDAYDDDDDEDDYGYGKSPAYSEGIPYDLYDDEAEIDERESELDVLVYNFIEGAMNGYDDDEITDDVLRDCKEHFLEYIYTEHGIQPYRPMILCDEMGKEIFSNFPYAYICDEV